MLIMRKTKEAFGKFVRPYRLRDKTYNARIGNFISGAVEVPGKNYTIYVTLEGSGELHEAINRACPSIYGYPVVVGYEPSSPRQLVVLYAAGVYGDDETPGDGLRTHGSDHSWRKGEVQGTDITYIWGEQIMHSLAYPHPSLPTVYIYPGVYRTSTGWIRLPKTAVDLTDSIPTSAGEARYALIVVNSSGAFAVRNGTAISGYNNLADDDKPEPLTGDNALWLVKCYYGQTRFRMSAGISDFEDVRFSGAQAGSTAPASIALDDLTDVAITTPADGQILQYVTDEWINSDLHIDSQDPTGFVNPGDIDVAYDITARTITLTGDLSYYWHGVKKSLTSPWTSDAHDSADGDYYLYTTDGATFAWSTTAWEFYMAMVAKAVKSTSPAYQFALRETHGLMPWQAHEEFHNQVSAYRHSGGSLTAGTYAENTATDAANSPGFDEALICDEDLDTTIPAWSQGTYTTMRIGASSAATFDTTATLPFRSSGSYILVNNPATGAETAAGNNQYVNVYQLLVPAASDADSKKYRMVMLQPQAAYSSLANAKAEDPRSLVFGDFVNSAPEFVIYARITYVLASGDSNTGKCRIATGGVSYVLGSKLSQISVGGFTPASHNSLTGLQGGTADEYYHLTAANAALVPTAVQPAQVRELLTAARTYYVATTGNDSNDGLTVGAPMLTIQHAYDVIVKTLDVAGYTVTIQLADGTYTAGLNARSWTGGGTVKLLGTSRTGTIINTAGACITATGVIQHLSLSTLKLMSSGGQGIFASSASVYISINDIDFGACYGWQMYANYASIYASGTYYISGGGSGHIVSISGKVDVSGRKVVLSNTPNFSSYLFTRAGQD